MSWNNIPNNDRLRLWKSLRKDISTLPLTEQLAAIAEFFSDMPYGARTLDYYSPDDWPTPWEILFNGTFCKSSISLLIFYTICFLHTECNAELQLINDGESEYLIPVIDDQFVLNYEPGAVNRYSDVSTMFTSKQSFSEHQIKKIT